MKNIKKIDDFLDKKSSRCTFMFVVLSNSVWSLFLGGSPCGSHWRWHSSHLEHQQLVSSYQALAPVLRLQVAGISGSRTLVRLQVAGLPSYIYRNNWSLRNKLSHPSYIYRWLVSPYQALAPVRLQVAGLSVPSSRTRLTSTGS